MTRSDVIDAIKLSVARGSATPTLGSEVRETYIERKVLELEEAIVDPVSATVHGTAFEHGLLDLLKDRSAVVVARRGQYWLGFVPQVGEFFLAYGPEPGQLNALGFHSNDVLAEWLG